MNPGPDFLRIIRVLSDHDVEFIVVGGVAAVRQGVPVTTADLDVVHRRTEENVARLRGVLDELGARSRLDPRGLRPGPSHLLPAGHQLLVTDAGLPDLLGEVAGEQSYDDLLPSTDEVELDGRAVRVLSLEKLLEIKARVGRPKDHPALLLIRHTLEEKRQQR